MHLKDLNVGPPGGWRYTCPECNVTSVGITFGQLMSNVRTHFQNMNHDMTEAANVVEAAICDSLSPADQVANCVTGARERRSVGWAEIVAFSTWLMKWWTGGRQLVSPEEANRRAAICASCPYNVTVTGCGVCRTSIGVLRNKLMKAEPTASNNKLLACGVCGCDLKTIVHVPLSTLHQRPEDFSKVPWCWENIGSENYRKIT